MAFWLIQIDAIRQLRCRNITGGERHFCLNLSDSINIRVARWMLANFIPTALVADYNRFCVGTW